LFKALKSIGSFSRYPREGEFSKKLQEEASRLIAADEEKIQAQLSEEFETELDRWTLVPGVRSAVRSLLLAVVSASWTVFETLLTDMWVAVLNCHPVPLAQRALEAPSFAGPDEVLSAKQVSVGLLAKYSFDLRNCLGDILKSKFDFTSVSGIHKAYKTILGDSEELRKATGTIELKELEAVRHLIVHRAGIVDEEYRKRTNSPLSSGTALPIDGITASRWASAGISSGCNMVRLVDCALLSLVVAGGPGDKS
jgi:hypothetical protein